MISRFEREHWGTQLPDRWLTNAKELMQQTFQQELEKAKLELEMFGATYPDELCLTLSVYPKDEKQKDLWTSFMLSTDLTPASKADKVIDSMLDAMGPLMDKYFDELFHSKEGPDYIANWEEDTFKDLTIHYKISHENIKLSMEADKWLKA